MNSCNRLFIVSALLACVVLPMTVGAESVSTLSQIPGLEAASENSDNFSGFINAIYRMSIGVGAALAVLVIIFSGIQYSMSAVGGKKAELRGRITMALGGLGLLLGAFVFLEFINPGLVNLSPRRLADLTFSSETYTPTIVKDVSFASGKTPEQVYQQVTNPTVAEYVAMFGKQPFDGQITNGRVTVSNNELIQWLNSQGQSSTMGIGTTIAPGLTRCDKNNKNRAFDVSLQGQQMVAAAIQVCPNIPQDWVSATSLYKIIACESGGQVGRVNYNLDSYMKSRRISQTQIAQDIKNDQFYSKHCCRKSSTLARAEQKRRGGPACNPGTQNGLADHIGACSSATGIGQLLVNNARQNYPSGVQGYGVAVEELCGMLTYIKNRSNYGHPDRAWALYNEQSFEGY